MSEGENESTGQETGEVERDGTNAAGVSLTSLNARGAVSLADGVLKLVLASRSPQRITLMEKAGFAFSIDPADIDEENYPRDILPADLAQRLAGDKAKAVSLRHPDAVVLAADTVVAFGDKVLGKPADEAEARRMLSLLEGTTHIVITGVAIKRESQDLFRSTRVMSGVRMRTLTGREIDRYVATNDWQGKAGGYGIQDRDPFVTRIAGDHTNIVGLPMKTVATMLRQVGVQPCDTRSSI